MSRQRRERPIGRVAFDCFALEADAARRDSLLRLTFAAYVTASVVVTLAALVLTIGDSLAWALALAGELLVVVVAMLLVTLTGGLAPAWPERCELERRSIMASRAKVAHEGGTDLPHTVRGRYLYASLRDVVPSELRRRSRLKTTGLVAAGMGPLIIYLVMAAVALVESMPTLGFAPVAGVALPYVVLLALPWAAWCALQPPGQMPWRETRELAFRQGVPQRELWRPNSRAVAHSEVVRKVPPSRGRHAR